MFNRRLEQIHVSIQSAVHIHLSYLMKRGNCTLTTLWFEEKWQEVLGSAVFCALQQV
jgi:hypothetical protein